MSGRNEPSRMKCGGVILGLVITVVGLVCAVAVGPIRAAELPLAATLSLGKVYGVAVKDNFAYAALPAEGKIVVMDIARPEAPEIVGECLTGPAPFHIVIAGSMAYVAARHGGVFVVDIEDPRAPRLVSTYDSVEWATGVAASGNILYVCCRSHGLELVDISNPERLQHLGTARIGEAQHVAVKENYAYVGLIGSRQLGVVDCSNPRSPKVVTRLDVDGHAYGVDLKDDLLFVATGHHSGSGEQGRGHGLEILSIADRENPTRIGGIKTPPFYLSSPDRWTVKVSGDYAFLADGINGVFVVDVKDPRNPRILGQGKVPHYAFDLALGENHVYVGGVNGGFHVFKAEGMAASSTSLQGEAMAVPSPGANANVLDGFRVFAPGAKICDAVLVGDSAFVAAGAQGIYVLELWPEIKEVAHCQTKGWARAVKCDGAYLFVAEGKEGMTVWDVTAKEKPVMMTRQDGNVNELSSPFNGFIVQSNGTQAVTVSGISTPAIPVKALAFQTPHYFSQFLDDGLFADRYFCLAYGNGVEMVDLKAMRRLEDPFPASSEKHIPVGLGAQGQKLIVIDGIYARCHMEVYDMGNPLSPQRIARVLIPGIKAGKVTVAGNRLYLANAASGTIGVVDIGDMENPNVLETIQTHGNCRNVIVGKKGLVVPDGYGGLLVRDCDNASTLSARMDEMREHYFSQHFDSRTNLIYGCGGGNAGRDKSLPSPEDIAAGKPQPWGHGSGMSDTALMSGDVLAALCELYDANGGERVADFARKIFSGMVFLAELSPEKGFIPRGPHPAHPQAYYKDSSGDQHWLWMFGMWRYCRSKLATTEEKKKIAELMQNVIERLQGNGWCLLVEDNSSPAIVGNPGRLTETTAALHYLALLAMAHSVTGDERWGEMYQKACTENNEKRLLWLLDKQDWTPRNPYASQTMNLLAVLSAYEQDSRRQDIFRNLRKRRAALGLDVIYPEGISEGHKPKYTQEELALCGDSLRLDGACDWRKRINLDLLYRRGEWLKHDKMWGVHHDYAIVRWPLVMFIQGMLSGDQELERKCRNEISEMLQMIDWSKRITWETRTRALIAGTLLEASLGH